MKNIIRNIFTRKTNADISSAVRSAYVRGFTAAQNHRLLSSLKGEYESINKLLKGQLAPLRAKARQLALNNDYVRRYVNLMKNHIVGVNGYSLQNRAKDPNGKLDEYANKIIEEQWRKWGKKASTDNRLSIVDIYRLDIHSLSVDGESIIRIVEGYDNAWGFALQPIDASLLDDQYNDTRPNGNIVRMGIEYDEWLRPVRYYFKPSQDDNEYRYHSKHEVISAENIIHSFSPDRANQGRGYPPIASAIMKLHNLNGYAEAEVVAARMGASKTMIYERQQGYDSEFHGQKNDEGEFIEELEPGMVGISPEGYTAKLLDPTHPNGNFGQFNKEMLKGIASGLGISYPTLGSDLENVNYTSSRTGLLEERDFYKVIQQNRIENLAEKIFERWLKMALLTGAVKLPFNKFDKFNAPQFFGRRWQWVDPLKDVEANKQALACGFTTLSDILAESGRDLLETLETLKREKALIKEYGLTLEPLPTSPLVFDNPKNKNSKTEGGEDA